MLFEKEGFEATVFHDAFHPQVHESSGMEQSCSIAGVCEQLSQRGACDVCVCFCFSLKRRIPRAQNSQQTLILSGYTA